MEFSAKTAKIIEGFASLFSREACNSGKRLVVTAIDREKKEITLELEGRWQEPDRRTPETTMRHARKRSTGFQNMCQNRGR